MSFLLSGRESGTFATVAVLRERIDDSQPVAIDAGVDICRVARSYLSRLTCGQGLQHPVDDGGIHAQRHFTLPSARHITAHYTVELTRLARPRFSASKAETPRNKPPGAANHSGRRWHSDCRRSVCPVTLDRRFRRAPATAPSAS